MILRRILVVVALLMLVAKSWANLPEDPGKYAEWESGILRAIEVERHNPPETAIPKLGTWVMQMALPANLEKDNRPVFHAAKEALLSIPGHAEYYRDRILRAQELLKNANPDSPGVTWSDYHKAIRNGFQTLPHLHSPEGVRVLGELMSNDWVLPGNKTRDLSEQVPVLSESATVALVAFPIKDKPFDEPVTRKNYESAHAAWRQWYEEIKSGRRTFRFEGDPTEYDLNGPAPKDKLERISRDMKRDAERAAGHGRTTGPSSVDTVADTGSPPKSVPIATVIAGLVLLGSVVWYFARERKRWGA